MLTLERIFQKERFSVKEILCTGFDIKAILHGAFLVNSTILAICFVVFDLEWKREAFNANRNCAWQSELLELFINAVAFYFLVLTLVSCCTTIMCIGRRSGTYRNAFYLLTLYSSATFVLSVILSICYFFGSRVIAEHCINNDEVKMLEFRMCIVSAAGVMTNGIYAIVGMIQGAREIAENVATSQHTSIAYDNQIFHLPMEFHRMPPPPPYNQNWLGAREVYIPSHSGFTTASAPHAETVDRRRS